MLCLHTFLTWLLIWNFLWRTINLILKMSCHFISSMNRKKTCKHHYFQTWLCSAWSQWWKLWDANDFSSTFYRMASQIKNQPLLYFVTTFHWYDLLKTNNSVFMWNLEENKEKHFIDKILGKKPVKFKPK